ncbi:calmodulin-binding protein [Nonomuraea sp. NPDC051941]|uniref:BP74-related protein n=1 Tax=Nonomuraea sp. NPDC051941 TaxID=3364373 RepID=UPI0037CC96DD
MRSILTRTVTAIVAIATLGLAAPVPAQAAARAYFEFTDFTQSRFIVEITDPDKIQHARDLLSGDTTDRPHVIGRIAPRPAPYNPRWSYQLRPETIDFFDVAIEVCDATIPYVEDNLDEAGGAFLPGYVWCPWSSKLVREIPTA